MEVSTYRSQEYQTALAINDWDYFLPRNHVNSPVEGKEYRIFQPQWKPIILFWLGRDDINFEEKEAFIQKLVNFDDGCGEWKHEIVDKGYYDYHAYFLAAAGINIFKECILSDKIVEEIVKWVGNINKRKWIINSALINESVRIVLAETITEKAITNLIQVLETADHPFTRHRLVSILREMAIGNELAIQELIRVLETTHTKETCWNIASILKEISVENELVIRDLIRILETTQNEDTCWRVAYSLKKIDPRNELAIREVIRVLKTTENEQTRRWLAETLGEIIQTKKQYADVVFSLKHNLTDEVYENTFGLFVEYYGLLWRCARNLPYPKFYQAWHHNTLTPNSNNNNCHSERSEESQRSFASQRSAQDDIIKSSGISNNTPVDNIPTVQQLGQQNSDISTQLSHLLFHCIAANKLQTLNTENKFVQAFCTRIYQKLLPDKTIPKVQTVTDLERKIIHLKQQLETPICSFCYWEMGHPPPK